ncbi:TetR/AcrR family transcriptional regulator [Nocardia sp. NPDC059240]|uniref:TetR/AcrR family transcriptional regulator n=1 Tax=Nocardia sp. NPDC059240 TaxID=3346786 RepID=UPI0036CF8044
MARKRPTERLELDTADRIVDGALKAAEHYGLRRLTMDQIARYAGIARVTIYTHFPNKDAIVSTGVARELERVLAQIQAAGENMTDPHERFVEQFTFAFGWLRDNPLLQRLIRTEPETILPYAAYDSPYLLVGRNWLAQQLNSMFAPAGTTSDAAPDFDDAAELTVRVVQSLLLSPLSNYTLDNDDEIRTLARRWLLPIVERASAGAKN